MAADPTWLFVSGLACSPDIWDQAPTRLRGVDVQTLALAPDVTTMAAAEACLLARVEALDPVGVVGHSLGGVLTLSLMVTGRVAGIRALIVDAFLDTPAPLFRNFVHHSGTPVEARVMAMLDALRPQFAPLRAAAWAWDPGEHWMTRCLATGAGFVYGGRAADDAELHQALGWPPGARERVGLRVIQKTSHFLMLEDPDAFYAVVQGFVDGSWDPRCAVRTPGRGPPASGSQRST